MNNTIESTAAPVAAAAIFDFDGTLVPHIDHGIHPHPKIEEMKTEMQTIKEEGGVIIGNTGRPPELIANDKTGLAELPFDYICSSVGTVILQPMVGQDGSIRLQRMPEYDEYLSTPLDQNKVPYNKQEIDALIAMQDGYNLQEPSKIGDSPRTGAYFTFKLPEGLDQGQVDAIVTGKIAEVKAQVTELLGINNADGIDAKCAVSKEKILDDGTVILNVDAMSAKADKIGATKWLLEHIARQRKERGTEPLNAVIVAGDSGNDKSNMDTAYYLEKGLQPAYVVPGNGHHDLVKYAKGEMDKGVIAYVGDALPTHLDTKSQEYFNHENYGLGGTLQGLKAVRNQLHERSNSNVAKQSGTIVSEASLLPRERRQDNKGFGR